jgi:hypothetical protein
MDKSWEVEIVIGFCFLQLVQFHSLFNFLLIKHPLVHPLSHLFGLIHSFNSPNSLFARFHMVLPFLGLSQGNWANRNLPPIHLLSNKNMITKWEVKLFGKSCALWDHQPKRSKNLYVPDCVLVNEPKYMPILWIQSLEFWCGNEQNLIDILCDCKMKKFKKETCYVLYIKGWTNFMHINVMKELYKTWSQTCMHHIKCTIYKVADLSL